jgi:FAD:protein FMN transferase
MKRNGFILFIAAVCLAACSSREQDPAFLSIRGSVFGTYYTISYYSHDSTDYLPAIDSLFAAFNQSLSYYVENSLISRINRNETDSVDDLFKVVFEKAWQVTSETGGAFDATVSPIVNAWGFGFSKRSEVTKELIDSLLQFTGPEKAWLDGNRLVKSDERVQFDFNAIAKGYASDVVGMFLESKGIDIYLVEIGGDLVVKGVKPNGNKWRIGLENPAATMYDTQEWDYFVEIEDIGLATSGNYRRYYEVDGQRYAHTIDPETGYPVTHSLLSASVFAPDGITADAYATAFMVMGLEKAIEFVEARDDLEAFFIYSTGGDQVEIVASQGLDLFKR